jgi:hypothetical protein
MNINNPIPVLLTTYNNQQTIPMPHYPPVLYTMSVIDPHVHILKN